jgi:hypothetical protein
VAGKGEVTLTFRLCGLSHTDTRPNPAVDIGFDNLRTIGLHGRNFGFESADHWTLRSGAPNLYAEVVRPSVREEAPPVSVAVGQAVVRAGSVVSIPVTVTNSGAEPMSGTVTTAAPDGWTVEPASASFGPVPGGRTTDVMLRVTVPAGADEGSHWLTLTATTPAGVGQAATRLQVIGDRVEFTPGTPAEGPWLVEPDGSQLDGEIFDGRGRFADGTTSFTYEFDLPPDVTGGSLTLHIGNQFLVKVSADGQSWREVLREDREIRDLSNLADRTLDLASIREAGKPLYVRIEDSRTDDGWGGWLGRLTLALTTEAAR